MSDNPYEKFVTVDGLRAMDNGGNLRAFVTIVMNDRTGAPLFEIRGCRILDGQHGLWLAMPSRTYEKDGETKYQNIVDVPSTALRAAFTNAGVAAYRAMAEAVDVEDVEEIPF